VIAGALLFGSIPALAAASAPKTDFNPSRDGFAFANDTTLEYRPDANGEIVAHRRTDAPGFRHGCFLMIRATLQFAKFARFAPELPKVSDDEYRRRLRHLFRISIWYPARPGGIVIPGYRNLYEFSSAKRAILEKTIGSWQATYFRVGNWRMSFPFPRCGQALAARRLIAALDEGKLQAVYLARNLKMNHCVLLYDYTLKPGGDVEFTIYDPNYAGQSAWLRYHAQTRTFELQKRFFFNRGTVNLMRVYISPVH